MAKEAKTTVVEAEVTEVKKTRKKPANTTKRKAPSRTRHAADEIAAEAMGINLAKHKMRGTKAILPRR